MKIIIALFAVTTTLVAPAVAKAENPWEYKVMEGLVSGELPYTSKVWEEVDLWINWSVTTSHPDYGMVSAFGKAYPESGQKPTFFRVELRRHDTGELGVVMVDESHADLVSQEVKFGAISFAQIYQGPWGVYESGTFHPFVFGLDRHSTPEEEWYRQETEAWEAFVKSYK
jgi:hypothetical protein